MPVRLIQNQIVGSDNPAAGGPLSVLGQFRIQKLPGLPPEVSWDGGAYQSIVGGGGGVDVEDSGAPQGNATTLDFTGAGVTATVVAGVATIDIPGGGGVDVEDSGAPQGNATTLDFTGDITATVAGTVATVNVTLPPATNPGTVDGGAGVATFAPTVDELDLTPSGPPASGVVFSVSNSFGSFVLSANEDQTVELKQPNLFDVGFAPTPIPGYGALYYNSAGAGLTFDDGGGPQAVLLAGGDISVTGVDIPDNTAPAFAITRTTGPGSPADYLRIDTTTGARTMTFGSIAVAGDPSQFIFNVSNNTAAFRVVGASGNQFFNVDTTFSQITLGNTTTNPSFAILGDGPFRVGNTSDSISIDLFERASGAPPGATANTCKQYVLDNGSGVSTLWAQNSNGDAVNLTAIPTVTGSRGGNAALTDLLTQLASIGFIVDATSP